jgi:hypothetical protein
MLPDYKRRKSDRALEQYFSVRFRTKNKLTLALPLPTLTYLALCVQFAVAVAVAGVVVGGVEAVALVEPSAPPSVVPGCWPASSLAAGISMNGVAPVPPVTRGKTPSHL